MKEVKFHDLSFKDRSLIARAKKIRENAHAIFSKYKVGAALLADNGEVYLGVNVEAPCCVTTHAEVNAINAMVTHGGKIIKSLCCVSDKMGIPCPHCCQKIWSFSGNNPNLKIIAVGAKDDTIRITTIGEICPYPSSGSLKVKDNNSKAYG